MYHDGLKVFRYLHKDIQDNPLPANLFEDLKIGLNLRGLITDLNIFSKYFSEEEMVTWTKSCQLTKGDIFSWNKSRLNITQKEDSPLSVSFVTMDKKDVCPNPTEIVVMQEPSKLGSKIESSLYKPRENDSSSYVGKVLELISDPYNKLPFGSLEINKVTNHYTLINRNKSKFFI